MFNRILFFFTESIILYFIVMKYHCFVFAVFLILIAYQIGYSQCERSEYPIIIRLAKEDIANRKYQRCIERLLDARDICPDEKEEVNRLIQEVFLKIENQLYKLSYEKNRADSMLLMLKRAQG